jgi:anoctamin-10
MSPAAEGSPRGIPYFTSLSWNIYLLKFALLDSSSPSSAMTKSQAMQSNLDVDYVVSYRFAKTGEQHTPRASERASAHNS